MIRFKCIVIKLFLIADADQQKCGVPTDTRSSMRSPQVVPDAEELVDRRCLLRQDAIGAAQVLFVGRREACSM